MLVRNGSIDAEEILGNIKFKMHNGKVKVTYAKTTSSMRNVSIIAHNGTIDFTSPPNFSASAEISVRNGMTLTSLPSLNVNGKILKKVKASVGKRGGKLRLQVCNGLIIIK